MFPKKIIPFLICFLTIVSCVDDLDFSQIDDYTASQSYSFSIAYFNVDSTSFLSPPGAPATTEVSQITDFKIFQNNFIKNNLTKIDFQFEINNEFNRDFTIEISLFDANGNLVKKLNDLKVQANKVNMPPIESILVSSSPNVKNTSRVNITIKIDDTTTPIQASDIGSVNFKSAATVYLETLN